jgi:flavin reductase (DIM6/NTAB) family NADH-FMN oxidoreductase RutF
MSGDLAFDFATLPPAQRYKLLVGLVVPRPIALVTSFGPGGIVNAAPFSFFNVFSEDPPLVVLGLQSKADGSVKDTSANIREHGTFVVNLVDEALAEGMNVCAVDFPREMSEIEVAGLTLSPSVAVEVPRIAEAPVALECKHFMTLEVSRERRLCIGQVVYLHAREGILDPKNLRVMLDAYRPVARLFGNYYASLGETFQLTRESYAQWEASGGLNGGRSGARQEPS